MEWDSKTGLVTGEENTERVPVAYTGKSYGTLAVGENYLDLKGGTIDYQFWYY